MLLGETAPSLVPAVEGDSDAPPPVEKRVIISVQWIMGGLNVDFDPQIACHFVVLNNTLSLVAESLSLVETSYMAVSNSNPDAVYVFHQNPVINKLHQDLSYQMLVVSHLRKSSANHAAIQFVERQMWELRKTLKIKLKEQLFIVKESVSHKEKKRAQKSRKEHGSVHFSFQVNVSILIKGGLLKLSVYPSPFTDKDVAWPDIGDEEQTMGFAPRRHGRPQSHGAIELEIPIPQFTLQLRFQSPDSIRSEEQEGHLQLALSMESPMDEIKLSPAILDFLSEAVSLLDKAAAAKNSRSAPTGATDENGPTQPNSAVSWNPDNLLNELSIRVTANFWMASSVVLLTCQPNSGVICKLVLPALSLFISSHPSLLLPMSGEDTINTPVRMLRIISATLLLSKLKITFFHPLVGINKAEDRPSANVQVEGVSINVMQYLSHGSNNSTKINKLTTDVARVMLSYDMRQLDDLVTFKNCWFKKHVVENIMGVSAMGGLNPPTNPLFSSLEPSTVTATETKTTLSTVFRINEVHFKTFLGKGIGEINFTVIKILLLSRIALGVSIFQCTIANISAGDRIFLSGTIVGGEISIDEVAFGGIRALRAPKPEKDFSQHFVSIAVQHLAFSLRCAINFVYTKIQPNLFGLYVYMSMCSLLFYFILFSLQIINSPFFILQTRIHGIYCRYHNPIILIVDVTRVQLRLKDAWVLTDPPVVKLELDSSYKDDSILETDPERYTSSISVDCVWDSIHVAVSKETQV